MNKYYHIKSSSDLYIVSNDAIRMLTGHYRRNIAGLLVLCGAELYMMYKIARIGSQYKDKAEELEKKLSEMHAPASMDDFVAEDDIFIVSEDDNQNVEDIMS